MQNLKLLFNKAQIRYVVSVDDCYSPSIIPENTDIVEFFHAHTQKAIEFCNEIGINSFEETLSSIGEDRDDYIEAVVGKLTKEQIELFKAKYYVPRTDEKKALESFCEKLVANDIIIKYEKIYSIKDAVELYENVEKHFEIASDKRVLWMIDKDFQKTSGSSDDGLVLISRFISEKKADNIYALTSAQMGDVDNETFRTYLSSDPSDKLLACVIHKHKIIEEAYNELYEQMYFGFRENYSGTIIDQLKENLSIAATTAGETIKSIGDEAIHKVFLLGSKSEGISPLETFQRLLMIILKTDITMRLCDNYDKLAKLIYDYANLCTWCAVKKDNDSDFKKIENIRRNECYDIKINELYSPVSYGDIFLINNTPYLLMAQSCNIVLRQDGNRKAQCATLVQIENSDKNDESHYLLDYYNPQQKHCVSYNKSINIDFSILDLCCLNNDGGLYLKDDFDLESVKHRYTEGIYIALQKIISHNRNIAKEYQLINEQKETLTIDDLINRVRAIYNDNSTQLTAFIDNGIQYNGMRLFRLNQNTTDDISKRYAEYHSRKGLDFDFARQFKMHEFEVKYNFDFSALGLENVEALKNLIPIFKYYQTKEFKKEELKSAINKEFNTYYCKHALHTSSQIAVGKVDLSTHTIMIDPHSIPVKVNNIVIHDVLNLKDDKITIKLAKDKVNKLIEKVTGTYVNEDTSQTIIISNKHVSFEFTVGQPFIVNSEILTDVIEFKFSLSDGIVLNF